MARKKKTQFAESLELNNRTYLHYYNRLTELALSMFEWKGLPDSVDPRFLELCLYQDGMCVFFKDEIIGELALQCMIGGKLDVYRIPTDRRAYATNGYQRELDENNSVLIFNNYLHTNTQWDVEMYARRLYEITRTIDVNVIAQKTPVLIQADETQRMTMMNLYEQYDGNQPFIFGNKSLDTNGIKVLSTNAPYVADKLTDLKSQIWNEALTFLGISNVNNVKKERLVTDEVVRNQGGVVASRYSRLESRRQACDKINAMFGLNVSVDYREDFNVLMEDKDQFEEETEESEVDDNE